MIFKRGNETILDFEVNSGTYVKSDTNEEYLDLNLYLSHKVNWQKNDTTTYNGKTYYLNEITIVEVMDSSIKWSYNLKFYPDYYSALDAMLTLDGRSSFSIDSTLSNLVDLVLASLNRVGSGWTKGEIENTTILHFDFNNQNCMQAIIMLAEAFDVEFSLENKVIQYTPKVFIPATSLRYEDDYTKLERTIGADHKIINRVYATGSSENLPSDYGSEYLTIPYIEDTASITRYGLVEGFYSNPDIKPTTQAVIDEHTTHGFIATRDIPYDINDYIQNNTKPIINFETGQLAGLSFYIDSSYLIQGNITSIYVTPINQGGVTIPNPNLTFNVGDIFNITNIQQPTEVVDIAEQHLRSEAMEYLNKHKGFDSEIKIELAFDTDFVPKFNQKVEINNNEYFIKRVAKNLTVPYNYSVELSFFRRRRLIYQGLVGRDFVAIINTDIQLQVQLPLAERNATDAIQLSTDTANQLPPIISDVAIANSNANNALDRTQFISASSGITELSSDLRLKYKLIAPSGAMGLNTTIDLATTKKNILTYENGILVGEN